MRATKPPRRRAGRGLVTYSRCQTARGEDHRFVSRVFVSTFCCPCPDLPLSSSFLFANSHSLFALSYSPSPMRSGRSAGIGARVLRAPGRSCHSATQTRVNALMTGRRGAAFCAPGRRTTVCAYRAGPDLGHPASQRRDARRSTLHRGDFWAGSRFALLGQSLRARAMTSSHRHGVILTRRTATRASRGSAANRRHAGLPHPAPPNRTASGRRPS
jgi:hypothetical protein